MRPQGEACYNCLSYDKGECPGYENCKDTVIGYINWKKKNE